MREVSDRKAMTVDDAASRTAGRGATCAPFFRYWMPYLYQRVQLAGRKHVYLPLNRNYTPFGVEGYADYQAYVRSHGVIFGRDPAKFQDVWWNVDEQGGRLWLYDDSAASRFDYFERLERLMLKANTLAVFEKVKR